MSFATAIVKKIQGILYNPRLEEENGIPQGIKECNRAVREINAALLKATSLGEKQHLTTALSLIRSFRQMFKALRVVGSGYVPRKETACRRVHWEDSASAFRDRIRTGVITNLKHTDPKLFLEDCEVLFRRRIRNALKKDEALKVNAVFCGEFVIDKADQIIEELKYINVKNVPIYRDTNLKEWFMINIQSPLLTEMEEFQEKSSGWALGAILNLQVNINKFTPQLGSSYIELPTSIKKKHACVNVKNDDEACFAWAIVSALHPVDRHAHPDRPSSYPHYSDVLNLTGIQFPMTMKQIPRFEKQNNISVNVYILKKTKKTFDVVPTYLTKNKMIKHVNLLLVQDQYYADDDDKDNDVLFTPTRYHYVWIKDLSRLVSSQLSKHKTKKFFCDRCFHYFYTQPGLDKHTEDCKNLNECKIRLPTGDQKMLTFKNFKNKEKAPFIIYADLECVLQPVDGIGKYQEHIPCSIGYYVKCSYDDSLSFYKSYRGEDCIKWFVSEIKQFAEDLETVFLCPLPMDELTSHQQTEFENAIECHICERSFMNDNIKVRDHCHFTGKYRGPAHQDCNINYQDSHVVPIVFHNLSGYDAHFLINDVATGIEGRVEVLPITKEKYISFTKNINENLIKFRFIDSFRFLSASLDTLASYLEAHSILKSEFSGLSDDQFNLLKKKGVFPYDYIDSLEKFNETKLPDQQCFYNRLEEKNISRDQYAHAQIVWEKFGCKNLGEYSDLYLKTDIMLLAEIFEQFRETSLINYGLDPAHYYTLPGYTWDCMLKYTKVDLELLDDIDMIMFIERGIRGGLSQCSKRYAKANNKYMPDYDSSKFNTYLMYYDINNQYGWAMEQALPYGGFKWTENYENFDVTDIPDDSGTGYILEVDLEYPEHLHDKHKDLPLCPEHLVPPGSKLPKLMACKCDEDGSKFPTCSSTGICVCKPNYTGNTCNTCKDGYWKTQNKDCVKCNCNEYGSIESSYCDKESGRCYCKTGVTGNNCNTCLPRHYGTIQSGCKECDPCNKKGHICDPQNGKCICPPLTEGEECQYCTEYAWGYEPGIGCKTCNCSQSGSSNLQCDKTRGKCTCKTGFEGEKCNRCSFGYYGYPDCKRCNCNLSGTAEGECQNGNCRCDSDGSCRCKENVRGKNCDACKNKTFGLTKENPKGCTPCFCFGRSNICVDGNFNWDKIRTEKISNDEIAVVDIDYWNLPEKFLGDLTTSYGGYLSVDVPGGYFRVKLEGNGIRLQSSSHNELQFIETNWNVASRNPRFPNSCQSNLTRACFMTVLQNVTTFLIEANDRIHEILLDKAKSDIPTYPSSHSVEKCECPKEYAGFSCQDPNEGYFRHFSTNPKDKWIDQVIGKAKPCECNGRSKQCHPNNGQCTNCTEHTTGAHCHLCDVGYYKDKDGNCSACLCPTASQNHAESCSPEKDSFICKCKKGYKGQFCDSCAESYFDKDPSPNSMACEPCGCNPFGVINGDLGLCNEFGICQCKDGFKGEKCDECINEREYIKNGICTPCDECTQLLFSEIDNLTLAVEDTFNLFKDGLSPPWKILTDTMDKHHLLSEKFEKKKKAAEHLIQDANLDYCTTKINTMEDKLKKENEIADQNTLNTDTLHVSSNELAKEVDSLSKQLKKIIENLENFGTKHVNLKDALKRAQEILRQIKEISKKFNENKDQETFYYCSNITEKVNSIYKPPANIPKQLLEDLKNKLKDIINITAAIENICDLAEEKNLRNEERIVKVKEKIEKLKNGKETAESTVKDIMSKISATEDIIHKLETVYEDLKSISTFEEYKELENRVKRQMEKGPEIDDLFIKALEHVRELERKINTYQSTFNFTKDEWKKIKASGAYEALITGIKEAKKNAELSREILEKATKIMDPEDADNIVDKANLAQAYSDRLKQRINNLKNISKSLNLIKNKLDRFRYSILESGKANNDLNQILHKMQLEITSQSDRVSKLEEAIGNSTKISDEMRQIEKKVYDMQFTSQYDFFKKYHKYLNLTSTEEIDKLKTKLTKSRKQLEDLDISSTYFDNIKKYNDENKNKNLQAIQEKIEGLRNRIYYAKQAADTINVAMNLTNCLMSYKLSQTEIFQSLSITFKCKNCNLFDWSNKQGQSLSLKVENFKPILSVEDKKITLDNAENRERTVNIQKFGSVIKMQLEDKKPEKILKIGSYYYIIDSEDDIKIGSTEKPFVENSYVYKVMLNERNFGLWKFTRTEGHCTGQKRETTDDQANNINTYYNGKGYHIYGRNKKLNPSKLTLGFDFSTFDENSLIYLAQENNCAYISLFLENGYLKLTVNHTNGVTSTLTLDNKYNNGRKYQAEITMEYDTKSGLQHYILFAKNDTSQDRKQSSNTLNKKSVFKIKQANHYIGGVPPTFNKSCIPVKTTSFLGFLSLTSQLTNESLSYGVSMTNKELLEFYQAWINRNGFLNITLAKEHINTISFILRPIQPNGLVMNLTQYVIYLNNYKLHIVGPKSTHTSDTALSKNDYNFVQMSVKLGVGALIINEKEEETMPFSDRINIQDLTIKVGSINGGFSGGLSTILINNKELSLNPNTVVEFSNVEIGREPPLVPKFNINIKSLSSNITNSMQNTEGCASFANYVTDPDAVKFGDKPNSYTYIKSNFWKQDYKISFEFRTYYPNGVIFISMGNHKQQHYNFLELREGKLHLSFKGRRKSTPIIINNKINDGQWHNVQIFKKKRKLMIILDGEQKKPYRIPKNVVRDEVYLGGVPSNSNYLDIKDLKDKLHPFRGCMKSLIINEEHKFLLKNSKHVIHSNIRQCFRNIEEGAYFGGDAYAVYKENFQVNKILELGFEFRTSEQNGILLSISNFRNSPALSVELQNGAIVMAVDMGNGVVSNVTNNLDSDIALCNNMWHNITAMYSSSELTVNVDGIRKSWVNNNSVMDEIDAPLYVGGLPDNAPIGTLKSRENFKGCIRKLKIEDKLMDWSDMKDLNNVLLNSCPVQHKTKKFNSKLETTNYTLIP